MTSCYYSLSFSVYSWVDEVDVLFKPVAYHEVNISVLIFSNLRVKAFVLPGRI